MKFLSGCEEVENCTSQLVELCIFQQPCNTTLLHEFYFATTRILITSPHNAYSHVSHTDLCANDGARIWLIFWVYIIGHLNIYLRGPNCEEVGNCTSQLPTTSQHHVLAQIYPHSFMNVNTLCRVLVYFQAFTDTNFAYLGGMARLSLPELLIKYQDDANCLLTI